MEQEEGVHQLRADLEAAQDSARHRPDREHPVIVGAFHHGTPGAERSIDRLDAGENHLAYGGLNAVSTDDQIELRPPSI